MGPIEELSSQLGPGAVLRAGDGLTAGYATPARGAPGPDVDVIRPRDTEEVCFVVRWACEHGVRLLPQGANSGLVGASTPPPDATGLVVLSTERLRHGLQIDQTDRTAIVPAGLRLGELNDAAGEFGLTFPIDLGADPSIGGMVATNTGGARMLRHGDVRRRTLGVEAVLADGAVSVLDTLRTHRKDNHGLDLTGLVVGSSGALGIVTRAALDLAVRPADTACAWIPIRRASDAIVLLEYLERRLDPLISAYEVVSAAALGAAAVAGQRLPLPPAPWAALVEVSGPRGCGELLVDAAETAPVDTGDAVVLPTEQAWAPRHAVSEGLARLGAVIGHDVAVPRAELPALVDEVGAAVTSRWPDLLVADFGHWGDGGVHLNVVVPGTRGVDEHLEADVHDVVFAIAVEQHGGTFSAEHGVGPSNASWWHRTVDPVEVKLTAALRASCDPLGILGHPGLPYPRDGQGAGQVSE
jgi:FAD/FMN-containing dehydrogenase